MFPTSVSGLTNFVRLTNGFDENGALRTDFSAALLRQAVEKVLQRENAYVSHQITLELVLQDGQVIGMGNHEQLMTGCEEYRYLAQIQMGDGKEAV